jgi:predicted nuclease with RNAse H fold
VRVVGIHLAQATGSSPGPRVSAVAEVGGGGELVRLELVETDGDILGALPPPPALVVADAPLAIPDAAGRRDVETVLAWCDVPAFPVSERRIVALHGGARGVSIGRTLAERGYETAEALPDLVLRELRWERERPPGLPPCDLRAYREAWLGVRAPAFRPGRRGRPRAGDVAEAHGLLADALDLGGWRPEQDPDPRAAVDDAARLDAIACAYAGWRHMTGAGCVDLGTPERGRVLIPADANLAGRIALHVKRLRAEGRIVIPVPPGGW